LLCPPLSAQTSLNDIAQPNDTLNQLAWRYREGLDARIAETREIIAKLGAEFTAESGR